MPHGLPLLRPDEGGAGAHADHHRPVLAAQGQAAHAHGGELLHLLRGDAVDVLVNVGGPHTRQGDPGHVPQLEAVGKKKIPHGPVQGGDGVLGLDPVHGDGGPAGLQTHNFGGGAADVNA